MTKNRCIELLKKMKHMFTETCAKIDENTALDMAVEAIEEIQQYRAITGITADDLRALEKDEIQTIGDVLNVFSEWYKYKAIGTTEEFKALKELTVTQSDIDAFKAYIDDCMDDVAFGNTDWNHSLALALKCMELHKA